MAVDVEKLKPSDEGEPEITGGYILKFDRPDPGDTGFKTSKGTPSSATFAYVTPKETFVTSTQGDWILNYLDAFESALYGPDFQDPEVGYAEYIDVDSFIDHHIIQELTKNPDGLRFSTYMFKARNGKLTSGPVWDFDRSMRPDNDGRASNPVGWGEFTNYEWWGRLFEDPNYERRYAERWRELRRGPPGLAHQHWGAGLALLGSDADRATNAVIGDSASVEAIDLSGCSLSDLMAALLRCRVVVSNDTGAAHLAAALGRPTVVLFGPTNPQRSAPRGNHVAVLSRGDFCQPCGYRNCPLDHRCLIDLSPATVLEAAQPFWQLHA